METTVINNLNTQKSFCNLWLNVCNLAPTEFILVEWYTTLLQVAQKSQLLGTKNQQSVSATAFTSCGSANSMDVFLHSLTWT